MANNHPLSFISLIIGVIFGCSLVLLWDQSLYQSYRFINSKQDYTHYRKSLWNENETTPTVVLDERGKNLFKKVRVLCWIMTNPANHKTKALAVKETWGSRCNILVFVSSELDSTLPTVKLVDGEGRDHLWDKTREAFRYIWKHYRDQADWFLKADDDTYVIVENLRYFLSGFNTQIPLWFGHKFKKIVKNGYFSGGAGYVLSKEAARRFVQDGYFNGLICRHDQKGAEDAEMGKCMQNLNVLSMDTRDSKGRGRFFPFVPEQHIFPGKITTGYWYWNNIYYPPTQGRECCSDSAISFHYVPPQQMYLFDYLIYQLQPFGVADQRPATPEPPPDVELTATPWTGPNETSSLNTTNMNKSKRNSANTLQFRRFGHSMRLQNTSTRTNVTDNSNNGTVVAANLGIKDRNTYNGLGSPALQRLLEVAFNNNNTRKFLERRDAIIKLLKSP